MSCVFPTTIPPTRTVVLGVTLTAILLGALDFAGSDLPVDPLNLAIGAATLLHS
jgi:hypothetical protein